jgi:ankyrin repeat protein
VDKENNNGVSPLMAAARDGFTAIVKVLLAAGADFEQVDGEWTSVCCISCVRKLDPASIMERAQCAPQDCTESSVSCGWQQVCNGSRAALTSMDPPPPPTPPTEFGRTADSVAQEKGFDETSAAVLEWAKEHPK